MGSSGNVFRFVGWLGLTIFILARYMTFPPLPAFTGWAVGVRVWVVG